MSIILLKPYLRLRSISLFIFVSISPRSSIGHNFFWGWNNEPARIGMYIYIYIYFVEKYNGLVAIIIMNSWHREHNELTLSIPSRLYGRATINTSPFKRISRIFFYTRDNIIRSLIFRLLDPFIFNCVFFFYGFYIHWDVSRSCFHKSFHYHDKMVSLNFS